MASAAAAAAAAARKNYTGGDQRCHLEKDEASFAHYTVCGVSFVVNDCYRPVQAIGTGAYGLVWFALVSFPELFLVFFSLLFFCFCSSFLLKQLGCQDRRGREPPQRGHQEGVAHVREHH